VSSLVIPAISRRSGRLLVAALVALLLFVAFAAVFASWRQTSMLDQSARITDRVGEQFDAMSMLHEQHTDLEGALAGNEHAHGDEDESVKLLGVLTRLGADDEHQADWTRIVEVQREVVTCTELLHAAVDRGDMAAASTIMADDLEPKLTRLETWLADEIAHERDNHESQISQVRRDSGLLRIGSLVAVVVGAGVLAILLIAGRDRRRAAEQRATCDALTGLLNRTAFQARLSESLDDAVSSGRPPTVLMLDLDRFKEVNDTLGHHYGDLLLIQVADRLRLHVRSGDLVARLGGDEFAVLVIDGGDDEAWGELAAERVSASFAQPFLLEELTVDIEASIGIATAAAGDGVTAVMRHADTAMYTAKEHGLDFIRHDPRQDDDTSSRLGLLGAMRRALDAGELEMYYQPKISVDGGQLLGAEALARWNHPTRGLVPPMEFIPVLESTSLIHRFTDRVLELSLTQVHAWREQGLEVPVAVNVSTRSLLDERFPGRVAEALVRADVPARLLCIEVTEHAVMTDPDLAVRVLRQIHDMGVRTSIDDFGTGYSSMAYLKVLPIDEIKVDRSFVMDMVTDPGNHVLVQSTVELGHNLGLSVVAEGVEDEDTLEALHRLNCDVVQGYLYARPQSSSAFTEWITTFAGAEGCGSVPSAAQLR
jgi:diguanylate cyclase (GGDEF)-like protein